MIEKIIKYSTTFKICDLSDAFTHTIFGGRSICATIGMLDDDLNLALKCNNYDSAIDYLIDIFAKRASDCIDRGFLGYREDDGTLDHNHREPTILDCFDIKKVKKRRDITLDDIMNLYEKLRLANEEESIWIMDVPMFDRISNMFSPRKREDAIKFIKLNATLFDTPVCLVDFPCSGIYCGNIKALKIINFELQPYIYSNFSDDSFPYFRSMRSRNHYLWGRFNISFRSHVDDKNKVNGIILDDAYWN